MSERSDFNDAGQCYGQGRVIDGIRSAGYVGDDHQTDTPTNEDQGQQQTHTRLELNGIIEAVDPADPDFFEKLTGPIAKLVAGSGLPTSSISFLRKLIAKKAKVPVSSLEEDAKSFNSISINKDENHLDGAMETIEAFWGKENLIYANNSLWTWRKSGVWKQVDDREVKKIIHEVALGNELTTMTVNSILDMVKTETYRPGHQFDQDGTFINCLNGELHHIKGGWILQPHVREHYRTTQIPIEYDLKAPAPMFEKFMGEVFLGDSDALEKTILVCELLGYTMLATCRFEKFVLLFGGGANGKSVLLAVVEAMAGRDSVCAVQPNQFENRFQRAHLNGKLANIVTEIAESGEINDAQLKAIVSGELTTAEHKHKPPFDFHPIATCWFGTNHLPHTRDFSDALFRRAIILQFNRKFEGKNCDPLLKEKLVKELPGILNLALEGIADVLQHGMFTTPSSTEDLKRTWRNEADQASQFVGDMCQLIPTARTVSADVWRVYQTWCSDAGIKRPLNRNNFTARLKRLGVEDSKGAHGIRVLSGIQLIDRQGMV